MIISISKELNKLILPKQLSDPKFIERFSNLSMVPFDLKDLNGIHAILRPTIGQMLKELQLREGRAYLTIDAKEVQAGTSQRRPGAHIDGNFLDDLYLKELRRTDPGGWTTGGGNGWKVGEGGNVLTSEQHKQSYRSDTGGMLIMSTYPACKGWNGVFNSEPGIGGDCAHVNLNEGFILKPNTVYYGNSQFIHESLPVDKNVFRVMVRVTLPTNYPVL